MQKLLLYLAQTLKVFAEQERWWHNTSEEGLINAENQA